MSSGKMLELQFLIKLVDGLFLLFDVFSCTGAKNSDMAPASFVLDLSHTKQVFASCECRRIVAE